MRKQLIFYITILSLMVVSISATTQVSKFKALYIYNICRYIEWPSGFGGGNFEIGIVGSDKDLLNDLKAVAASKKIQNKTINAKIIKSAAEAKACHVVYFSKGSEGKITEYNSSISNGLIIGNSSSSIGNGAGINFFMDSNKLKFELKKSNIKSKGLSINNDLLKLAAKSY